MVGVPDPVPAVPERQQRIGRQIVRGVGLTGQQMGQPGEFGVMGLEELMELGGSGIVDDCAHGYLSVHSIPCTRVVPLCTFPGTARGARAGRERTSAPRKRFDSGA